MKISLTMSEEVTVREWPPGHRLFSSGGFHMSFDPPDGGEMPAILLKIDELRDAATIMVIEVFTSDEDALEWFAAQRRKLGN